MKRKNVKIGMTLKRIKGGVEINKIISELKGERAHNPNMKMTNAQINDMVADIVSEQLSSGGSMAVGKGKK